MDVHRRTTTRLKLERLRKGNVSDPKPRPRHAMPLPRAHAGARWGRGAERGETGGGSQKPNRRSARSLRGAPGDPCDVIAARLLSALCQGADRIIGATFLSGDWWYGRTARLPPRRCEQEEERR